MRDWLRSVGQRFVGHAPAQKMVLARDYLMLSLSLSLSLFLPASKWTQKLLPSCLESQDEGSERMRVSTEPRSSLVERDECYLKKALQT